MVSVAAGKDEILAKQIEVKATGASDVKIYANGANQKAGGVDVTDNSKGKTTVREGGCLKPAKGKDDLFGINKPKKNNPFGNFDINGNGKLDPEELVAMKAYVDAMLKKGKAKPNKIKPAAPDCNINPFKPNNEMLLIILGMLIAQLIQQEQNNFLNNNPQKATKKPLLEAVA